MAPPVFFFSSHSGGPWNWFAETRLGTNLTDGSTESTCARASTGSAASVMATKRDEDAYAHTRTHMHESAGGFGQQNGARGVVCLPRGQTTTLPLLLQLLLLLLN